MAILFTGKIETLKPRKSAPDYLWNNATSLEVQRVHSLLIENDQRQRAFFLRKLDFLVDRESLYGSALLSYGRNKGAREKANERASWSGLGPLILRCPRLLRFYFRPS